MATTPAWKIKKRLVYKQKNEIIRNHKDIKACEKIVLPGVGAFDDAMSELRKQEPK